MLTYKEACEKLCERYPNWKVIGCCEYKNGYACNIVPIDAKPIERKGTRWYNYIDNDYLVDKNTGEISDLSSLPSDVEEASKYMKPIFYELDDGYAYWLGKE